MTSAPTSLIAYGLANKSLAGVIAKRAFTREPRYGLAFRFTVSIGRLTLGNWSSCSGLRVDFGSDDLKPGGNYLAQEWIPGRASYGKVTLKRAVEPEATQKVQGWLIGVAEGWLKNVESEMTAAPDASIMLYDANGEALLKWVLTGVRPAAWAVSEFDAKKNDLVYETLELKHAGFEVMAPSAQPKQSAAAAAELTITDTEGALVKFAVPPEQIVVIHNGDPDRGRPTFAQENSGESGKPNVTQYKLNKLTLIGTDVVDKVKQLSTWAKEKTQPQASGGEPKIYELTLKWGEAFPDSKFRISSVSATLTRFTEAGRPVRASVDLTIDELRADGATGDQNPTSGGIPGRSSHVVDATDSLAMLARRHYGIEAGWRDIAEANGIDDPLRLRPGRTLYLPAPEELSLGVR